MPFRNINRFILLGGGQLLFDIAIDIAKKIDVQVISSKRHMVSVVKTTQGAMALKDALEQSNIPYVVVANVNTDSEVGSMITKNTVGISLGAEWIFKRKFIEKFSGKLVNLHGSRLPKTRGGGGFSWLILRNERHGGTTLHMVDDGIDTGDIIMQREYVFPSSCRKPMDYQEIAYKENLSLLREFIQNIEDSFEFEITPQQAHLSSYWPRLNTEQQGLINWNWSLGEIEQFICAFDEPYKGASTFVKGERIYVKNCKTSWEDGTFHPFQVGLVYKKVRDLLFIATCEGGLILGDMRNEIGESIINQIRLGDRLYTPGHMLEEALVYRHVYKPEEQDSSVPSK